MYSASRTLDSRRSIRTFAALVATLVAAAAPTLAAPAPPACPASASSARSSGIVVIAGTGRARFVASPTPSEGGTNYGGTWRGFGPGFDVATSVGGVAFRPESDLLVLTHPHEDDVHVLHVGEEPTGVILDVGDAPIAASFFPDSDLFTVVSSHDDGLWLLDGAQGSLVASAPTGDGPVDVAVSGDGERIYVLNNGDDTLAMHDAVSLALLAIVPTADGPVAMDLREDGALGLVHVVSADADAYQAYDALTLALLVTVETGDWPVDVAADPSGEFVWVVNQGDDTTMIIETAGFTVHRNGLATGDGPTAIAFWNRDENRPAVAGDGVYSALVVGGLDGSLYEYDDQGQLQATADSLAGARAVVAGCFAPAMTGAQ